MKPNFTASFFIVYLLYIQCLFADTKTYTISCAHTSVTEDGTAETHVTSLECKTSATLPKTKLSSTDGDTIPCVCPENSARVIYYRCAAGSNGSAAWQPTSIAEIPSQNVDPIILTTDSGINGCYACGVGNFLVGTTCYSCAEKTGSLYATTKEEDVSGIQNCYIPEDTSNLEDEKGIFSYMADCYFDCTESTNELCTSNL